MPIETAEEFFAVLEKSKLLATEQLADARLATRESDDPRAIAKTLVHQQALTRWQAGQLLAGRSSFFLGKYKLIEPIGRGGMGGVFLGEHTTMNRRVALKILSRQVGKNPASLDRFLAEARAIAALDHPNIVQAYSVDHDADRYYLVMEYIDGRDLQQLVEVDGLPEFETAADYIRQAADGLAHGHQRNMIHCDIKPSNLLVNSQGVVKIGDMGLARLNQRNGEETNGQDAGVLGSVDYLAPEQAVESPDFDHRADIYSLGCTLYFLLTGHPPFPEGTLAERIMKHQTQQPRSVRKQRRDAPPGLVRICEKMMAKRPEDRFQSAEEVSRALAEWRPPETSRRRATPLKTAQPLEEPAGRGLPTINVDAESPPAAAGATGEEDPSKKAGLLQTRRRKIAAAVGALLFVGVLAAAATALLIGPASAPDEHDPAQAGRNRPAGRRPTPPDKTGQSHRKTPAEKPPAEKPPPKETPAEKPPREKPPAEKPPAEKPPAEKPDTQPKPTEEPGPEQPEPNQPKQEPQPPEKEPGGPNKRDPFRHLASAVDLPLLRASPGPDGQPDAPVSLGKLDVEPGASLDIELKGGEHALAGNRQFAIDRSEDGKGWLIHLDASSKQGTDPQRTDVARIWLEKQVLKFQWLKEAGRARGNYLRNCGLSIRVGEQTRWLPLTRPKKVQPLVLDLDDGVARTPLPTADWMPKIGTLRLQVTALEGPFPSHVFKPDDGISEDDRVDVLLSGEKLPMVGLAVRLASRGRKASVEVAAAHRLADQVERPFKSQEALQLAREFFTLQSGLQKTLEKLNDQDPRRPDVERRIELCKEALEQLKSLGDLYHRVHHVGKIHFRVFHIVDGHQIDLFTTKTAGPEGPEEPDDDQHSDRR